jgi:NAD(P)-dependent dehydrogenase (short-subunit alcohol dehydrogenase family)
VSSRQSLEDARRFFEVRYWGAVAAVKYAASQIRRGGSIVLSSGMAGHRPRKGWTIAASVCGAMESLTVRLRSNSLRSASTSSARDW